MKKVCKSFLLLTVMIFSISTFAYVCFTDTADADGSLSFEYSADDINSGMENMAQYFAGMSDAELEYYIDNHVGMNKKAFESFKAVKDKGIGTYISSEECKIKEYDDYIMADMVINFADEDVKMTAKFQYISEDVIPVDIEFSIISNDEDVSLGSKMSTAGLNTLMGIGTVVIVLIFLSLIISLFAIVPAIQSKKAGKKKEEKIIEKTIEEDVEEELVDDLELVAVITAAIAASENGQADGFVVRSIKRRPQNRWKNA